MILNDIYSARSILLRDAEALMTIYNREVLSSRVTLDLVPRTISQQRAWIEEHQGVYPALLAFETATEKVVGFASVSPYRIRPGYSTTVENSIYIAPDHQGKGLGKLLLGAILSEASRFGFHACIARVAADHNVSISLHKSLGYFEVGIEREIGRKFGKWIDMLLLEKLL